ncbi:indolepyruvate oxidoreductase subunit beta [bacterium]|nr:indolepyruvate oxidoreductase subunit beta [bacterium]
MKYDIVLAGVGGQGVLSLSAIIASSAMREGLEVKQSEVHGMAQRGGAVLAHLRLSDKRIHSDLIPKGTAQMILSMELLEALRYLDFLSPGARVVTAQNPFINIPDYPELDQLISVVKGLPGAIIVDAEKMAKEAGSVRATNMVMVGAASSFLPVKRETLLALIEETFARKGEKVVEINKKAFEAGRG